MGTIHREESGEAGIKQALRYAEEIIRQREAVKKTKSQKLKTDYLKAIYQEEKELRFYCKCNKISYNNIFKVVLNGKKERANCQSS